MVETKIKDRDEEGVPVNVSTDFKVHTVSLVDTNALGMNISKVKSKGDIDENKQEVADLMSKIDKAKQLDSEQAEEQKTEVDEQSTEVTEETAPEGSQEPEEQPEVDTDEAEAQEGDEVEKSKSEETPDGAEPEEGDLEGTTEDLETESEGQEADKEKAFTMSDMIEARKIALDGVKDTVDKIVAAVPDADWCDVYDLVYTSLWDVEDAHYEASHSMWQEIYDRVYNQVAEEVQKQKALKVVQASSVADKVKALRAAGDEETANLIESLEADKVEKEKQLEADRKESRKQKMLSDISEKFKRLATEDNDVNAIADALIVVEDSTPEAATVIRKALDTAANILTSGDLFKSVGSGDAEVALTASEYVDSKAKSLVDSGDVESIALAREKVRQSEDYKRQYG